jgi:hypothetical protein
MCKRCRCTHKLNKRPKGLYVKFVLNWKSSYDVMLLMFQSRQQHFTEFKFVRFLDQGYARIIHFYLQY